MLDFQIHQAAFSFGLAEDTDPRHVPMGTLMTLENGMWSQSGRIDKRFGTVNISNVVGIGTGGTIPSASRIFARGNELCVTDGANLYAYSTVTSSFRNVDTVCPAAMTWSTLADTTSGAMAMDMAVSAAGLTVVAWIQGDPGLVAYGGTGNSMVLVRGVNGETLLGPFILTSDPNHLIRVLIIGTTAYILTQDGTSIYAATINLTTMAVAFPGNILANVKVQGWDACLIGSNIVIAYEATGGGLKLAAFNSALTAGATGSISGEAGNTINCISIDGLTAESLYVAYYVASSGLVRIACADPSTLTQTVAPVTLETLTSSGGPGQAAFAVGVTRYSSTNALVAWSAIGKASAATTATLRTSSVRFNLVGTIDTTLSGTTAGVRLITRPFVLGGNCYAMATDYPASGFNPIGVAAGGLSTVLLRLDVAGATNFPHRYSGKSEVLIGGYLVRGAVSRTALVSSTSVTCVAPFTSAASPSTSVYGAVSRQGIRLVSVAIGASVPADMWRTASYGQEAYIAGPLLCAYDGAKVFDYGFSREPSYTNATTAAGTVLAGTYLYSFVHEYRSNAGMLHRSQPAAPATVVLGGSLNVTVTSLTSPLSLKQTTATLTGAGSTSPVLAAVYRSVAGGSVTQRLTIDPSYNAVFSNSTLTENSFLDTRPDSNIGTSTTLASRPPLYTTGGILDDFQPIGSVTMFHHVDRLWVLSGDQKTWWYSKAFGDDQGTAPGFNPAFTLTFEDTQVAGAGMDDKAVFFSATGIMVMFGLGPAPNGQNSDFTPPQKVQTDVGCINPRSVVSTPDGIMFQSARGIHLLTRQLEVVWIGRPIKTDLAAYPNITSAVLVAKYNQVRFTSNNAVPNGIVLVYDYVEKKWSTAKYTVGGAFGFYGTAIADACMWQGSWTFVTPDAHIYQESETTNMDAGAWVPLTLETAWISAAGPMAFQSAREFALHGISNTDHNLTINVGFDSNTTYQQVATWLAQTPVTSVGVEDLNVIIGTRRKCATIRFKIQDATPSSGTVGTGAGPSWDAMALEVGMKRGNPSNPATNRA